MLNLSDRAHVNKNNILTDVIWILENMTNDWDVGFLDKIDLETYLIADLAFDSIKFVQLAEAIQEHFKRKELPFQELIMPNDRVVDDLMVSDVVDFLCTHLSSP